VEEFAVPVILPAGLRVISFREIRADQYPVSTFAERLTGDRRKTGFHRLAELMLDR
jgi:hypothetical protein